MTAHSGYTADTFHLQARATACERARKDARAPPKPGRDHSADALKPQPSSFPADPCPAAIATPRYSRRRPQRLRAEHAPRPRSGRDARLCPAHMLAAAQTRPRSGLGAHGLPVAPPMVLLGLRGDGAASSPRASPASVHGRPRGARVCTATPIHATVATFIAPSSGDPTCLAACVWHGRPPTGPAGRAIWWPRATRRFLRTPALQLWWLCSGVGAVRRRKHAHPQLARVCTFARAVRPFCGQARMASGSRSS